jgi:hypothetical protein
MLNKGIEPPPADRTGDIQTTGVHRRVYCTEDHHEEV